ncbi:hypothetical protein GCM10010099_23820 [Streptomyces cinereus]|nr:hypothetical protein GCM10010099_23820 [Streptomyces cinereus]
MSKGSLALSTLYTLTALWLAWLTVNTWSHAPLWASVLNLAASIVAVMAVVAESDHTDVQRDLRAQIERATRATLTEPADPPGDPLVIPESERAVFDEITAGFNDKDQTA